VVNTKFDSTDVDSLTKRELEVLELLANGASNQEIAAALFVEVTTVKWYNTQIYDKLQVKNRKQAIIRAQTLGILKANSSNLLQPMQHNLPADTLPFIGRVTEIQEIAQQLTDEKLRLVTILGVGGMGKTRLSIEVARKLVAHFTDGVYFLSLAPVISAEQMVTTLAEIIGFKFHSDIQPKQQLLRHFQSQHILLIFDNFEHLLDSAEFITEILQHAPKVKVLVTSREKLNLAGEVVHILSGLLAPFEDETKALTDYDAVKLFVESAKRTGIEFKENDTTVVAHICSLLGGMPLAILLAAAWVDTLAIAEIEAEILAGLGILEGNLRDSPMRHQSIQAAFDVSWKRLSPQEQAVFMRLSVFRDGFNREAAQKITVASVRDLQRLVHTSFIQLLPSGRYTIHELMRQYGEQKLRSSGEWDTVREKHAQFFAEFITPLGGTAWGLATREMLAEVGADFENVRAAWLFQAERKNIAELRRFLDGLWLLFDSYSRTQEGIALFEPLLSRFSRNSADEELFRGQLLVRLGWCYSDTGDLQKATQLYQQALQIVQAFNSIDDILFLHQGLQLAMMISNNEQAGIDYIEKGFELAQQHPSSKWLIPIAYHLAYSHLSSGRYEEAKRCIKALPENHLWHAGFKSAYLFTLSEYAKAEEVLLDSLSQYQHHRIGFLGTYCDLTECAIGQHNYDRAWKYIVQGLQYGDDGNYAWGTFGLLGLVVKLLMIEQHYSLAAELLYLVKHHPASNESTRKRIVELETTLKTHLTLNEFEAAWERGKLLDLGDVITEYMER
jgi:predicted ATPase/DNA-binding CsgD family transcriptional regulator